MADKKISALTGATTPLAGTEVLPIVQSGSTVKVAVSDLTLGRSVNTAGGTFTDNLVQGVAAKGVNFTANTPVTGMTSRLLGWYEEGTQTLNVTASSGTITTATCVITYTRIGRNILVTGTVTVTTNGTGAGTLLIAPLPFTPAFNACGIGRDNAVGGKTVAFAVSASSTTMTANNYDNTYPAASGSAIRFSVNYVV